MMQSYPQVLVNVRTTERVNDPASDLAEEIVLAENMMNGDGRILVRASGTEPLARVMVEASTQERAEAIAHELAEVLITRHGGAIEGGH
jgi:phosphoglucosamine mutase